MKAAFESIEERKSSREWRDLPSERISAIKTPTRRVSVLVQLQSVIMVPLSFKIKRTTSNGPKVKWWQQLGNSTERRNIWDYPLGCLRYAGLCICYLVTEQVK